MSAKEVTDLRKQGKLQEALDLATINLENKPDDIWNKRAISWVYYAKLKNAQSKNDRNDFLSQLNNIKELDLPETESMVFDSCAWSIGKFLFANKEIDNIFLDSIFNTIKEFYFTKKSDAYSYLLKAFKKHSNNWSQFIEFTKWWNLDNFQTKDFENYVLDNGKSTPSLVEGIYISIAKQLLGLNNIDLIKEFIPTIAYVATTYNNMQYPPYYYAKLLIASGDKEHFMKAFLPFAKKKSRDFWVWNLISENFDRTSDEYFSCLCKAATCGAPDKFTGDVREKLANIFISKEQYPEAKFELSRIIEARNKEGWSLKDKHIGWQNFAWWNQIVASKNNFNLYKNNLSLSEGLLYSDIPEDIIIVDRINKEKSVLNFVATKQKYGFFNYSKYNINPKIGDIYAVRLEERKDKASNFYRIKSIVETTKVVNIEIYKMIEGKVIINQGNSFGFVKNIFVSPEVINKHNLKNGDSINGYAIQTYNSKRKAWGWNVIKVKR